MKNASKEKIFKRRQIFFSWLTVIFYISLVIIGVVFHLWGFEFECALDYHAPDVEITAIKTTMNHCLIAGIFPALGSIITSAVWASDDDFTKKYFRLW